MSMHKLLERQLRKLGALPEGPEFAAFIAAVDAAYTQADKDRQLVERSLELASQELLQRNRQLREDIERRKQLEMELAQAEKLRAVGQLASGIAHELNTPIQYVADNVVFLKNAFEALSETSVANLEQISDARKRRKLEFMRSNIPSAVEAAADGCRRVSEIVSAMKIFAHPDGTEFAHADINRGLSSTLAVARNAIKYQAEAHLDLGVLPDVECRIGDLNQVFLNLIVNAAHAVGEKNGASGQLGNIWISTRAAGERVVIEVRDDGSGIPDAVRSRIFEPFFTTKEVGRGTGQGLAISRSIVTEKHGGTLTFTTAPGEGTTFRVELPVSRAPCEPKRPSRRAVEPAVRAGSGLHAAVGGAHSLTRSSRS
jgi:two-component system NtrC family sensor kinase